MTAVIFDCDGVLIDSEALSSDIISDLVASLGVPISRTDMRLRATGHSFPYWGPRLEADYGIRLPDDFVDRYRTAIWDKFTTDLQVLDGVAAMLGTLDLPIAVASNARLSYLDHWIDHFDLRRFFGAHIYSAEHVPAPKPAPYIYLHAAFKLGVDPKSCFVVEDSPTGTKAGVAAGMTVIGFAGASHCGTGHGQSLLAEGARAVIDHLSKLPALLGR
jgi:HAD superfamily hydrolase (TIGR01509 family)